MSIQGLISRKYEDLTMTDELKAELAGCVPVTFRVREDYLSILQSMADLFKTSRASLGAHILETAIEDAFMVLDSDHCKAFAEKADAVHMPGYQGFWCNQAYARDCVPVRMEDLL